MSQIEFLDVSTAKLSDHQWPDVYFSPQYGHIVESSDQADWEVAIGAGGKILQAYLKREISNGYFDIISPYGYAGIHCSDDVSTRELAKFRAEFKSSMKKEGCVSEFLRLSQISTDVQSVSRADVDMDISKHNSTILLDIKNDYDSFFKQCEGRARTAVRKAIKLGYSDIVRPIEACDLIKGSVFRELYESTMQGIGADNYYFFDDTYYQRFYAQLKDCCHLVQILNRDGVCVVAGLYMEHGSMLHLHLVGSNRESLKDGAGTYLYDRAANWVAGHKSLRYIHLGGGRSEGDPLYKFKASFGGDVKNYHVSKSIFNIESYNNLIAERARQLNCTFDQLQSSNFFPAYRVDNIQ